MSKRLPSNWKDRTRGDDWTKEELDMLIALRRHNVPPARIAGVLGTRSRPATIAKCLRLGIAPSQMGKRDDI